MALSVHFTSTANLKRFSFLQVLQVHVITVEQLARLNFERLELLSSKRSAGRKYGLVGTFGTAKLEGTLAWVPPDPPTQSVQPIASCSNPLNRHPKNWLCSPNSNVPVENRIVNCFENCIENRTETRTENRIENCLENWEFTRNCSKILATKIAGQKFQTSEFAAGVCKSQNGVDARDFKL